MAKREREYPEKIIIAFLSFYRGVDIQREAGISKSKYYDLKSDQAFQRVLRDRRDEITRQALQEMQNSFSHNIHVLQSIIDNPEEKNQVRVNAISLFMSQFGQWKDRTELTARISALEEIAEENARDA